VNLQLVVYVVLLKFHNAEALLVLLAQVLHMHLQVMMKSVSRLDQRRMVVRLSSY
jgi:hypothetical protein